MTRSAAWCAAAVLCGSVLTACGSEQGGADLGAGDSLPADSIAAIFGWPAASELARKYCPGHEPGHLPTDVVDGEVFICTSESRSVAGEGTWEFAVVREVTEGADALLATYATPDEPVTGGNCTSDLPDPRIVWVRAGATHTVRAPHDACGKPMADAAE